jgi:cell wall-associated NlpC family hydrolase
MKHWAYDLVGAPYCAHARGPDKFDCVGLVHYYFKHRHGIELPLYTLESSMTELLRFARGTGFRRVDGPAQDDDIMLCKNLIGRHVGVVVKTEEGLGLLHAEGNNERGSVIWQPLSSLIAYREKELWRHSC